MAEHLDRVVTYLVAQSWQITMLVVMVALLSWLLRNRSAHIRYLLWLVVLAKCLVPPVLDVPVAVLPAPEPPVASEAFFTPILAGAAPATPTAGDERPVPAMSPGPSVSASLSTGQRLALLWMAGAMIFALAALTKAARTARWLRRQRRRLPADLRTAIEVLLSPLGIKRRPRIWVVEGIGQPFVWGLARGEIYLPTHFARLEDRGHQRDILGHELSHILRFDAAVNTLQIVAQGIFWFHPFVWWANLRIRQEREKCCDEMAIARFGAGVKSYSTAIIETVTRAQGSVRPVPSLAVAGSLKHIEERIRTMMTPGKTFHTRPSLVAAIVVVLIAFLTVPTALVLTAEAHEKTAAAPLPARTAKDKAATTAALFQAIRDKNVERMRLAINQGADLEGKKNFLIDNVQSIGCTPLYAAVGVPGGGKNELVRVLLEAGANPNTRGSDGQIPLHEAARDWGTQAVEILVSAGSDVNAADKEGRTPAIIAFELGRYNTFDLLVGKGATVSTDLMSAYKGNLSRVQRLIENGEARGRFEQDLTLLHAAAAGGQAAIVDVLLTNGLDVGSKTQEGYTAMHYAAVGNHRAVAELLLAKGADVNTEPGKQTPLHWAIREQHKDMIGWLLASGANPNADGGNWWATPLHWAVWHEDIETAVALVSHGGDIHLVTKTFPYSPLLDSVLKGQRAMVDALVVKTGDTGAAKWAPLHTAVVSGDMQATEDLLAKGADVNAKGEMGLLALHLAARKGHQDILELLVEKGADVNAQSENTVWDPGMTALHSACAGGQKAVAELLIAKGANVNAKSKNGYTPLHMASTEGYKDVAELLIARGADVNAKDNYGRPPLSLARRRNRTEIVGLLRKHKVTE